MRAVAVAIVALGIIAFVDKSANNGRYTDAMLRMAIEIKRGFIG